MKNQKTTTMFARVDEWRQSGTSMKDFASNIGLTVSVPPTPYFPIDLSDIFLQQIRVL